MTTERPILFSAPMVRALLDGSKTQTRRPLRAGTWFDAQHGVIKQAPAGLACTGFAPVPCPYGKPGDRLWVRETCRADASQTGPFGVTYMADAAFRPIGSGQHQRWADLHTYGGVFGKQVPSIHMPRWASRITLEVTGIRVECLQDISRGDAMAEGCPFANMAAGPDPRDWYRDLWNEINGPGAWGLSPWVWVVAFKVVKP